MNDFLQEKEFVFYVFEENFIQFKLENYSMVYKTNMEFNLMGYMEMF